MSTQSPTTSDVRRSARLGRLLIGIGLIGLVAAVIVVVLGSRFVDRTAATITDSLDLTAEAVQAFDETIVVAAEATEVVASGLGTITDAVADSEATLESAGELMDSTADVLSGAVPDSVDAIRQTMPALIQTAELLEEALGALSLLGVDFSPERPPADSLRNIEGRLTDVVGTLRESAVRLETVGLGFGDLSRSAGSLTGELETLSASLERADQLLDGYSSTTQRTALLVEQARSDVDAQRTEGRLVVLLLGLLLGLGQVVPLSLGWHMRRTQDPALSVDPGGDTHHHGPTMAPESDVLGLDLDDAGR